VDYFTGKALEYDMMEEDDDDDYEDIDDDLDDDLDDDSDSDGSVPPRKKGGKGKGGRDGANPEDCKQQ